MLFWGASSLPNTPKQENQQNSEESESAPLSPTEPVGQSPPGAQQTRITQSRRVDSAVDDAMMVTDSGVKPPASAHTAPISLSELTRFKQFLVATLS
jgi:hypothetical protein